MTCVWDSLLAGVRRLHVFERTMDSLEFARYVQTRNAKIGHHDVLVDGRQLRASEIEECFCWIRDMNVSENGYLCSAHDPLLIFTSVLFRVRILHTFLGHQHDFAPSMSIAGTISLNSSNSHMRLVSAELENITKRQSSISSATSMTLYSQVRCADNAVSRESHVEATSTKVVLKTIEPAVRVRVQQIQVSATPIFSLNQLRDASFRSLR